MKKITSLCLGLLMSLAMSGCNLSGSSSSQTPSSEPTSTPTSETSSVASSETTSESTSETSTDTSSDTSEDTSSDVSSDTSSDTSGDTSSDVSSDTSSDVSSDTSEDSSDPTPQIVTVDAGDAAAAIANPGKFYYTKDDDSSVSGVVEDGVSKISISGMTAYNSVVFYYEAPEVETGGRYELSFNLKSKANLSYVTVNNTVYELMKGDNTISFRFTESDDPTITIVMGDATNEMIVANNEIELSTPVVTDVVYKDLAVTVDGSLAEWAETRNEENHISVIGSGDYEGKGVKFYASLQADGLYVAAEARHAKYISTDGTWWKNSNLEFFLGDSNVQGWIAANGSKSKATDTVWNTTGSDETGYYTIVEGFIPTNNLPAGSVVAGETRVGFAWKTIGDKCNNGEANGGAQDEYWVPKGTWPNNADKGYVTKDGIFRKSQVSFEITDFKTVTLDGDLSDWEGITGVNLTGTGDYSYKDVTWYARRTSEGMFIAAKAHHDVYINDDPTWHMNTNLEFWVNGNNQKYISANGNAAGGVYGTHKTTELTGEGAKYETVFECVIPSAYLDGLLDADGNVAIGFAFKTNGDVMTGGGANGGKEDAWWILPGRGQNNKAEQFVVTENGLVDPLADTEE